MTGLIFDSREELGNAPGLHAFIIGISHYPNLKEFHEDLPEKVKKLVAPHSSAANDAVQLCEWMIQHQNQFTVPLATIRLLLSPSLDVRFEGVANARVSDLYSAASEWREDACNSTENVTLFYCSGIAFGTSNDDVALVTASVGESRSQSFRDIISFDSLYRGMRPAKHANSIARTQYYFVNTSRASLPSSVLTASPVFDIPFGYRDDRIAPIFYSAVPGSTSSGITRMGPSSWFLIGLLSALEGNAASRTDEYRNGNLVWEVTVNSLNQALEEFFDQMELVILTLKFKQIYSLGGSVRDARIITLDKPPPNRALILDNQTDGAGVHALIIGVSDYLHLPGGRASEAHTTLGMKQLTSAARSATAFKDWLIRTADLLPVPLATVRLLTSALPENNKTKLLKLPKLPVQNGEGLGDRPTLANFLASASEWRLAASRHPESVTIFYFVGHGAQRKQDDMVLMLEDFGDSRGGLLKNTVNINNLWEGMAPFGNNKNIARTQWYFFDACRTPPEQFKPYAWMNTTPIFDEPIGAIDDRERPMLFATIPGTTAYGRPDGLTLFTEALLACLNEVEVTGDGSESIEYRASDLNKSLRSQFKEVKEQSSMMSGQYSKDPIFLLKTTQ